MADGTQAQQLVYDDGPGEPLAVVDSTEDELLEPIRFNEDTQHWHYSLHDVSYLEDGHTFVYSIQIPRERVYYALEETE
ncbi:hypothetical protein [Haloprofundus salilacus]|uniref:hypothetical protein n=1 Tax=Haloprofundus salilacus TaxID=2876190 RepID=UPI001CCE339F|nr:hypothetical protein [Haloprofundus salilacus]